MEIFVDGGLFELIIGVAFAYVINYIFLKKYLLIIFSAVSIFSPVALLLFRFGELYHWLVGICITNSILLVALLWKQRSNFPNRSLIDVDKLRKHFPKFTLSRERSK